MAWNDMYEDDEPDDQQRALMRILSPVPAQDLVLRPMANYRGQQSMMPQSPARTDQVVRNYGDVSALTNPLLHNLGTPAPIPASAPASMPVRVAAPQSPQLRQRALRVPYQGQRYQGATQSPMVTAGVGNMTGVSSPPDDAITTSQDAPYSVRPDINPDPNGSLRPGGTNPEAQPGALANALPALAPASVTGPQQLQPASASGLQPPRKHGWADTLGSILVPGAMEMIPGSSLGEQRLASIAQQRQKAAADIADTQSQTAERAAQGRRADAQAAGMQPVEVTDDMHSQYPSLPVGSYVRPADLGAVFKAGTQNIGKESVANTQADAKRDVAQMNIDALEGVRQATENLKKAQADAANADPNTPAGKMALAKLRAAMDGHGAAMVRAQAALINAKGGYMGTDANGNPLNGIGLTPNGTPIGTHVQGNYNKSIAGVARSNNIYGALDNAMAAIDAGEKQGAAFNSPEMAVALSDPKTTVGQWLTGQVNTTLSPEEQNIVITTKQLREQLNGMRQSVGGGVSDAQINRLIDELPSATTPSLDYARKQLDSVRGDLARMGAGITPVNNGPQLRPAGSPEEPVSPSGIPARAGRHSSGGGNMPPQSVIDSMKDGQFVHSRDGKTSYQKKGGKLVPVGGR